MRRPVIVLALLVLATNAFGIDDAKPRGRRIALLDVSPRADVSKGTFNTLRGALRDQLRSAGFEAFDVADTYETMRRGDGGADYYVEIAWAEREGSESGVASVAVGHAGIEISAVDVLTTAEVRLFDGPSFDLMRSYELHRENTMITPSAIGVGSRGFFASIILVPMFERAQLRSAAKGVAREAAQKIAADIDHK
jgi:hypothetical protein